MSHFNFQGGIKLPSKYENLDISDFKFKKKKVLHWKYTSILFFKSHSKKEKEKRKKPETKQDQDSKRNQELRGVEYFCSLDWSEDISGYCICPNLTKCTY